jgi:hypothetical protein
VLSGSTWKGSKLRVGEAKPDFQERYGLIAHVISFCIHVLLASAASMSPPPPIPNARSNDGGCFVVLTALLPWTCHS